MIIRSIILKNPELVVANFDWFNDYDDTLAFLYRTLRAEDTLDSLADKIQTALELLISNKPRTTKRTKSNYIDPVRVSNSIIVDIKKQGFTIEEIEKMTDEDAFKAYCEWQGEKNLGLWSSRLIEVLRELSQSCNRLSQ